MKTHFKSNEDLRKLCFNILAEEMGITADNLIQEIQAKKKNLSVTNNWEQAKIH